MAALHSEFFRVSGGEGDSISLIARHAVGDAEETRRLTPEFVQALLTTAIAIHEREAGRDLRKTQYLQFWGSVIAAGAAVIAAFVSVFN